MKLKQTYINLIQKIFTNDADNQDKDKFNNLVLANPQILKEYQMLKSLWNEAENAGVFQHIDVQSDWQKVRAGLGTNISTRYHRMGWSGYFLRIAAVLIIAVGLTLFIYKHLMPPQNADDGFVILNSDNHIQEFVLPDGSSITLNAGSTLTYNQTFGQQSRDVIMEGEAYFNVMHNESVPFKVFVRESVIEVTGTSFTIRDNNGTVEVTVLSGTVQLSPIDNISRKVQIVTNQSGYLLADSEITVKDGIDVNNLSWKTGLLSFDETPIDSALFDIAHHFRRELYITTNIHNEITAEFQDQPLYEILKEIEIVAGLKFDTTGNSLIVRQ